MGGRTYVFLSLLLYVRRVAPSSICIFCMLPDCYDLALTVTATTMLFMQFHFFSLLLVLVVGLLSSVGCWRPRKWTERASRSASLNSSVDSPVLPPRCPRAWALLAPLLVPVGAARRELPVVLLPRRIAPARTCSRAWTCWPYPRMAPSGAMLRFAPVLGGRQAAARLQSIRRPCPAITGAG